MSRIFFGTPRVSRVTRVTRDTSTSRARPLIYRRNHTGSYLHSHRYKMFIRAVVSNCPLIITWMVRKTMEINAIAWSQVRDQFKRGFVPDLLAIAFNSWTTCNYLSRTCYTEHFFAQLVLQWWLWSIAIARAGVLHYAMKSLRRNVSLKTNLQLQLNRSCKHKSYSFVWFAFKVGLFLRPVEEVHAVWIATAEPLRDKLYGGCYTLLSQKTTAYCFRNFKKRDLTCHATTFTFVWNVTRRVSCTKNFIV